MKQSKIGIYILILALIFATGCVSVIGTSEYEISGGIVDTEGKPIDGVVLQIQGDKNDIIVEDFDYFGGWATSVKGVVTVTPVCQDYIFEPANITVDSADDEVNFLGTYAVYNISGRAVDQDGLPIDGLVLNITGDTTLTIDEFDEEGNWETDVTGVITITPEHRSYLFDPEYVETDKADREVNFVGALKLPVLWKHLMLIYPEIDTNITLNDGTTRNYRGSIPEGHIETIKEAFRCLPDRITDGSNGDVLTEITIIQLDKTLTKVSKLWLEEDGEWSYWLSHDDVKADINKYAPKGKYDSVHAIWPDAGIKTYFGLGGILIHDKTTTYDSLISGREWWWQEPPGSLGEPLLHEWLHGVTGYMVSQGYRLTNFPKDDLHGAELYGYNTSAWEGWMKWYRDYMQCNVWDESRERYLGISRKAWAIGPPTSYVQ